MAPHKKGKKGSQTTMSLSRKLGQILLEKNAVSSQQLAQAMALQMAHNAMAVKKLRIGEILLLQKILALPQLHEALRIQGPAPNAKPERPKTSPKESDDQSWMTSTRFKR